jgi:hypothetical protein
MQRPVLLSDSFSSSSSAITVCAFVCDHWTQRKVTVDAEKSDKKKIRRP